MAGLGDKDGSAILDGRARRARRGLARALAVAAVLVLVLAGCGWRPLYERPAAAPTSGGASAALAQISIDPVVPKSSLDPLTTGSTDQLYDSRAAQLLQNYLKTALNPYGPPNAVSYHLAIQLQQEMRTAVSLGNGQSTREDLTMTAEYQLNDAKGEAVMKDVASIVTSYDILREPFSDLSSRRDAQQRAAQELAQAIQTRLAVFVKK